MKYDDGYVANVAHVAVLADAGVPHDQYDDYTVEDDEEYEDGDYDDAYSGICPGGIF